MIKHLYKTLTQNGKRLLAVAVVSFILYALAGTAFMLLVLDLIERLSSGQVVDLQHYWILLVGLIVLKAIFSSIADIAEHFAGFDIVCQVRELIIRRLKQYSLGFYTKERLGEISTIIHKDIDTIEHVVGHTWSGMASDFITALILGIGLFIVDWRLGLAMISLVPVALWILRSGLTSGGELQNRSQNALADMVSLFVEYVKGIPLLKAFRESREFEQRLKASAERFGTGSKKMARWTAFQLGRYSLLLELSFALMTTAGAFLVFRNELTIYQYLMFVIVSREFYKPFVNVEAHWNNTIKVTDSFRRVLTVLDAPQVQTPAIPQKPVGYDISFKHVGFKYEENGFAFSNVSFTVKQGSLTALVGPSGSGKTTVTNLLLRFWEPQQGVIEIGGTDIRKMDYDDLLDSIGIVMQNVVLFADTIAANIKIGNRNATPDQVVAAAKKAMIHDDIMALPKGYETNIGENGVGLSGGQKQRLSIARAFLKDAPVVILDEMTSNVDPVNEAKIQRAISNLAVNRTVLVIAHHLNTIQSADTILVFNKGELVQGGSHDELLSQGGLYRKLWKRQAQLKEMQNQPSQSGGDVEVTCAIC